MKTIWIKSVLVLLVVSGCLSVPQGRVRARQQQQQQEVVPSQQPSHNLDPTAVETGMNQEHAKLIENLQRLKRTLDTVKERVGKGTYGESASVDMKNPEGAILTVLKSLQEQGQLFAMINDMLKAGSEVQNHTDKIQAYSKIQEQARAESAMAEHTNQIAPGSPSAVPTVHNVPSSAIPMVSPSAAPTTSGQYASGSTTQSGSSGKNKNADYSKQHGYGNEDYQYQYRDDNPETTGDDQYDYHYDAQGYDSPRSPVVTTTTTTTTRRPPPQRRLRGRITRSQYY